MMHAVWMKTSANIFGTGTKLGTNLGYLISRLLWAGHGPICLQGEEVEWIRATRLSVLHTFGFLCFK
jgi:hypothetical protein